MTGNPRGVCKKPNERELTLTRRWRTACGKRRNKVELLCMWRVQNHLW